MHESMRSSMSTSIQIAKECLQDKDTTQFYPAESQRNVGPGEGLEMLARMIDSGTFQFRRCCVSYIQFSILQYQMFYFFVLFFSACEGEGPPCRHRFPYRACAKRGSWRCCSRDTRQKVRGYYWCYREKRVTKNHQCQIYSTIFFHFDVSHQHPVLRRSWGINCGKQPGHHARSRAEGRQRVRSRLLLDEKVHPRRHIHLHGRVPSGGENIHPWPPWPLRLCYRGIIFVPFSNLRPVLWTPVFFRVLCRWCPIRYVLVLSIWKWVICFLRPFGDDSEPRFSSHLYS